MVCWALWARAARELGVALAVVGDEWVRELPMLCPGARVLGVATCPQTGALVLRVVGCDELLLLLPEPKSQGSRTAGNGLGW